MGAPAKKRKKGSVIKITDFLRDRLSALRSHDKESYDAVIRRHFGLPSWKGHEQPLKHYYVIDTQNDLKVFRTKAEAYGEAILLAVKRGQKRTDKRAVGVPKVRELP
jgi:hypothetical protein